MAFYSCSMVLGEMLPVKFATDSLCLVSQPDSGQGQGSFPFSV